MRLVLTRPRPESEVLADLLRARGHDVVIEPMLEIRWSDAPPDLEGVGALIATSANGLRAFAALSPRRDLPVYAVGDATAAAGQAVGFAIVESAGGDVSTLARYLSTHRSRLGGTLLHVCGEETIGDLAGALPDLKVRRAVVYEARPAGTLSSAFIADQGRWDGVLFFSPRSAKTFVTLLVQAGLAGRATTMSAYCLSRAVADAAANLSWRRIAIAARPDRAAMLDLLSTP